MCSFEVVIKSALIIDLGLVRGDVGHRSKLSCC